MIQRNVQACATRFNRTIAWSSADRKAERSRGENGFGPPVTAPAERRSSIRLRVASVRPMESSVKTRPFGAMTLAPAFTARLASGISAVTTILPGTARSAITATLTNLSEATGNEETIQIVTTQMRDGNLLYLIAVAPSREFGSYRNVFQRVVSSVEF